MHKKTIYFHIGIHKTGTTYLQRFMRENSAVLEEARICYHGKCTEETGRRITKGFHKVMAGFKHNKHYDALIVSDEDLSHNINDVAFQLIGRYRLDFDVKVICYIREIVSYYISFYSYTGISHSRKASAPECESLSQFVDIQTAYIATHDLLLKLVETLGRQAIIVRPFARKCFPDGKIENDFLSIVGCKTTNFHAIRLHNVSPNLKEAEKMHYALKLTDNAAVRTKIKEKIRRDYSGDQENWTITKEELDQIYGKYHKYELNIIQVFFEKNGSEDIFDKTYSHWLQEIERAKKTRFLTKSEKQEIREFAVIAQNELILEHQLMARLSILLRELRLAKAGQVLRSLTGGRSSS